MGSLQRAQQQQPAPLAFVIVVVVVAIKKRSRLNDLVLFSRLILFVLLLD